MRPLRQADELIGLVRLVRLVDQARSALKLHALLDLRGAIPAFSHISDGKLHDVNVLDIQPVQAAALYLMGRGDVDFERLYGPHQAGALFVT